MDRRSLLASSAAAIALTAGCSSSCSGTDGNAPSTATQTPALSGGDESYADGFTEGGSWPVHCFDSGRRGVNPDATPPTGDVGAAWLRTPVDGRRTFRTTAPATDERRVYVGSGSGHDEDDRRGGFVAAFDGETGERAWRTTVTSGVVDGVAHADGTVLATSSDFDIAEFGLPPGSASEGRVGYSVEITGWL